MDLQARRESLFADAGELQFEFQKPSVLMVNFA
jgi:hypothetical protein